MLSSTHFITGAAIGKFTGNPLLAVVFGLVSHFLMDLIPHWDYGYHFKKRIDSFLIAMSDPAVGLVIYLLIGYFSHFTANQWINSFLGGAICLVPDIMGVFIKLFKIKQLKWFNFFHDRLHWFIKEKYDVFEWKKGYITKKGIVLGVLYQIPFIIASLWFLIR